MFFISKCFLLFRAISFCLGYAPRVRAISLVMAFILGPLCYGLFLFPRDSVHWFSWFKYKLSWFRCVCICSNFSIIWSGINWVVCCFVNILCRSSVRMNGLGHWSIVLVFLLCCVKSLFVFSCIFDKFFICWDIVCVNSNWDSMMSVLELC